MAELYLRKARGITAERLAELRAHLGHATDLVAGKACVYATGSFGRLEAGDHSDLDLFIISDVDTQKKDEDGPKRLLDGLSEIKLKCELIGAAEKIGIKKFDAGGKYLESHRINSFTDWLGSRHDDYHNTLTGRMLMLLESKCLIGGPIFDRTIDQVLDKYFRDFDGHEDAFVPAFLFNDVLRMWRTFCLKYEYNRKGESREKIKNLKLKFSRMLTCFSGIIYLLAVFSRNRTVIPNDVRTMISLTPTERLEAVSSVSPRPELDGGTAIDRFVLEALTAYSEFLEITHLPERQAVKTYTQDESAWREKSYAFGESLSRLIDVLGGTSAEAARLRRLILI